MFQPVKNKILVKEAKEEMSKGGIIIPPTAENFVCEGTLIAVGPEVERMPEGSKILYKPRVGQEIKIDDETYLIMIDEDIWGYIEPECEGVPF